MVDIIVDKKSKIINVNTDYDFSILTTISGYLFPILIFLLALYLFLFHKIENKFSIVTNIIEKNKRKINKKYGIDWDKEDEDDIYDAVRCKIWCDGAKWMQKAILNEG